MRVAQSRSRRSDSSLRRTSARSSKTYFVPFRPSDRQPAPPRTTAVRFALIAMVWLAALGATLAIDAYVQRAVFVFFWLAVLFAAWYSGLAAAIVAAIGAVLAVNYFLLPPVHHFTAPSGADLLTLSIFVVASALVSALASAAAGAQRAARATTAELADANRRLLAAAHDADAARREADAARARVTAILDALGDAVTAFDAEWRCTYLNPAAAVGLRSLGYDPEALIGRVVWDELPALRGSAFERDARRAVSEHVTLASEGEIDGSGRWIESRAVPGPDGTLTVYTRDVTRRRERRAAERAAADRAQRLLALSVGLSEARTATEVADVIFREGMAAVGADAGSLGIVHPADDGGAEVEIVRTAGYAQPIVDRFHRFPLTAGRPLSDAVIARTPRLLGSTAEWRSIYPESLAGADGLGYEGFAAVPIISGGRALAAIGFSFREARDFDDATRTFLATIGEQCGLALERARAFEAERAARAFNAETLASIRDAFIAFDHDFRFTYVNARAEEMLRRSADSMVGRVLWDALPEARDSSFGRAMRHVAETRREETLEDFAPVSRAWVEARIYPASHGITIFYQDVTERRRAREASEFLAEAGGLLNASLNFESTLRTVAEAAVPMLADWCAVDILRDPASDAWPPQLDRVAIVHRDPAMVALGLDLAARYPTDWSARGGLAGAIRDATPTLVRAVTDDMIVAGARDATHLEMLRRLRFSAIIVAPLVARGRTLGALTLCMTESERRFDDADFGLAQELAQRAATAVDNARLYREAERARREAERANKAKSEFLSTMSHELRTPLNALLGYTELMDAGIRGPVTEAQRADLARMRRSAKVLMSLVTDVLNFARVEAGRVEFRLADVSVATVISQLEALVAPQMQAKHIAYEHLECDGAVRVRADAERLQQVLTNLLTNAIKFTAEGGRISVRCDVSAVDRAGVPGVAHIRVGDTGRGIPAEQLGRIFEPFVQVDRHLTHDSQQGVGLGLAISRDLARQMGGDLSAESAEGAGSTFTLSLPLAPDDAR